MGRTLISSYRPQMGLIRRILISRSNLSLPVKHAKTQSLLFNAQLNVPEAGITLSIALGSKW